jgi:hypothetical protein
VDIFFLLFTYSLIGFPTLQLYKNARDELAVAVMGEEICELVLKGIVEAPVVWVSCQIA